MSTTPDPYRGFRYPPDVINEAVWLYYCFSLSLREVELILARRGGLDTDDPAVELSLWTGVRDEVAPASAAARRQVAHG